MTLPLVLALIGLLPECPEPLPVRARLAGRVASLEAAPTRAALAELRAMDAPP